MISFSLVESQFPTIEDVSIWMGNGYLGYKRPNYTFIFVKMHLGCIQIIFDVQFKEKRSMEIGRYENISRSCFMLSKNQDKKFRFESICLEVQFINHN